MFSRRRLASQAGRALVGRRHFFVVQVDPGFFIKLRGEFRGHDDIEAPPGYGPSHHGLAVSGPIVIGGVEKVDPHIDGRVNRRIDSSSSTAPQPIGSVVVPSVRSNGPPMAQQPKPTALTSISLRPSRRAVAFCTSVTLSLLP